MKTLLTLLLGGLIALPSFGQQNPEKMLALYKVEKYRKMKSTGRVLAIGGTVLTVVGLSTLMNVSTTTTPNNPSQPDALTDREIGGLLAYVGGVLSVGAGVPLWIVGAHAQNKWQKKLDGMAVRMRVTPESAALGVTIPLARQSSSWR